MIRACSLPAAVSPLQLSSIQLAAVNITDGVSGMPAVVHLLCSSQLLSLPVACELQPCIWRCWFGAWCCTAVDASNQVHGA